MHAFVQAGGVGVVVGRLTSVGRAGRIPAPTPNGHGSRVHSCVSRFKIQTPTPTNVWVLLRLSQRTVVVPLLAFCAAGRGRGQSFRTGLELSTGPDSAKPPYNGAA